MRTILAIILLTVSTLSAQPKTNFIAQLDWDKSNETYPVGYFAYCSTNSFYNGTNQLVVTNLTAKIDAGTNLTATISNLALNTLYYFVVTVYSTNSGTNVESDYSNQLTLSVAKPPPTRLRVSIKMVVQAAPCPDGPWLDMAPLPEYAEVTDNMLEFWRVAMTPSVTPE